MGTNNISGANDEIVEKHCLHPELKQGKKGETVCSSCGRIVYLAKPTEKGSGDNAPSKKKK